MKRVILDALSNRGYDLQKNEGSFPPYRLLKHLRLGKDALADIHSILGDNISCVFDVGAHVGQTAARFLDAFPHANIFSFEPDPHSFTKLRSLAERAGRLTAINAGLGDAAGDATFFINTFDQTSSFLKPARGAGAFLVSPGALETRAQTRAALLTLDAFCAERGIDRIDVLKLDAQGYELRILDGGATLLNGLAVPLIHLEVSFVPIYEGQPLFDEVYQYLYQRGYRLVSLYDNSFHTHCYAVAANAMFVHHTSGQRKR